MVQREIDVLAEATARRIVSELRGLGCLVKPNRWRGGADICAPGWRAAAEIAETLRKAGWRVYQTEQDMDGRFLADRFSVLPRAGA